ncbi:hypothetical protein OH146_08800 [Salinibacterium sp. SYSU T00001]|uniref:hypothetical protein n=1 Tax=Homoserinimonas sedimenticola TaxID=2986805 RepID=UPI002235650A|nr:hypothetical protein [Salinibacterium sedimenticola]MCW4385871.1 hypothetical protein [Salinibacterium sedimenticola]
MRRFQLPEWADDFVLASDLTSPAELSELRRRRASGDLMRVLPGAYLPRAVHNALAHERAHLATVRAAALTARDELVFAHQSAAVLWRMPLLGPPPSRAHVSVPPQAGGRSNQSLVRHASSRAFDPVEVDGLLTTPLARTAVDLAAALPFDAAVVVADAALRRTKSPLAGVPLTDVSPESLRREACRIPLRRGAARASLAINFADGAAQLPGESVSRVSMLRAGVPAPVLQQELVGASGATYYVDFWWPQFVLIGEFDGAAKYSDPVFLAGRTPEQALLDEKAREDDLRLAGYRFCRWTWDVARNPRALRHRLALAGMPL